VRHSKLQTKQTRHFQNIGPATTTYIEMEF